MLVTRPNYVLLFAPIAAQLVHSSMRRAFQESKYDENDRCLFCYAHLARLKTSSYPVQLMMRHCKSTNQAIS